MQNETDMKIVINKVREIGVVSILKSNGMQKINSTRIKFPVFKNVLITMGLLIILLSNHHNHCHHLLHHQLLSLGIVGFLKQKRAVRASLFIK